MLVLARKPGERIMIGDDITIQVIEVHRGKIRLGVVAPKNVKVFREELLPEDDPRRAKEAVP